MLSLVGTTSSQVISEAVTALVGRLEGYLLDSVPMILAVVGVGLGLRLLIHYSRLAAGTTGRLNSLGPEDWAEEFGFLEYGSAEYDEWATAVGEAVGVTESGELFVQQEFDFEESPYWQGSFDELPAFDGAFELDRGDEDGDEGEVDDGEDYGGELVSVSPATDLWGEDWEARFGDG
jgi:hypothetical protein